MNLADIPLERLHRGQQLIAPGTLRTSQIITARLELLDAIEAKPLKEQTRLRFHHLASELLGTIRFVDDTEGELKPGRSAFVQIRLESPVVAVTGDRFVIRRYSPAFTIGGGVILDAHLPKLSRGTRTEILETLASGSLAERVDLMTKLAGIRGLTIEEVQARTGITVSALRAQLKEIKKIHPDVLADFLRRSIEFLDHYFKTNKMAINVPKSEFVQKLAPFNAEFLLRDLEREKIVIVQGDVLEIPGRSKTLGGAEGELARSIEKRFADAGLQPPPVSEIINEKTYKPKMIEGVISFLVKQGTLVRLGEGIYVHRDALAAAREKLGSRKGETIDVGQFKDFFGLSRKIAIPLLEWLDANGATKRVGDSRRIL